MGIEIQILDWIQRIRSPMGDIFWSQITKLGDAGVVWILLAVALILIPATRRTGWILAAALLVDFILCNGILKNLFARTRPFDINSAIALLIEKPGDYSFPSGHTAASFASASAMYFAGERKLWIPVFLLAILITFSRLYLYVHFPTDILGGMAVGIFSGYVGFKIVKKWEKDYKKEA